MKKSILLIFGIIAIINTYAQFPFDSTLVAFYAFNSNTNDQSGNGYDGIVHGATLTPDRHGNIDGAYNFNGIDNYIELSAHTAAFNSLQEATVSFWIYAVTDASTNVFSLTDGYDGYYNNKIGVGNNNTGTLTDELVITSHRCTTGDYWIAGYTTANRDMLYDAKWHHLVYVYDNVETRIYFDNVLLSLSCNYGSNSGHFGSVTNATLTFIGARIWNGVIGAYFNGKLDDFIIFNTALDAAHVDTLFNLGNVVNIDLVSNLAENIHIYPNPSSGKITIQAENMQGVEVINMQGKQVYTCKETEIDLSQQPKGIYIIKVTTYKGVAVEKVVLE